MAAGVAIAQSGSAWGQTAYDGAQYMCMQGGGWAYQAISGLKVRCDLYRFLGRIQPRLSVWRQRLLCLMDSTVIDPLHDVPGTDWVPRTSAKFTATASSMTLLFQAYDSLGGDRSASSTPYPSRRARW